MDIKQKRYEDVDWIHLAQDGFHWTSVNTVLKISIP